MNRLTTFFVLFLGLSGASLLYFLPGRSDVVQTEIQVPDLKCPNCVQKVSRALEQVHGVKKANVSLADKMARIEFSAHETSRARLIEAIRDAGYAKAGANAKTQEKAIHECDGENGSCCDAKAETSNF